MPSGPADVRGVVTSNASSCDGLAGAHRLGGLANRGDDVLVPRATAVPHALDGAEVATVRSHSGDRLVDGASSDVVKCRRFHWTPLSFAATIFIRTGAARSILSEARHSPPWCPDRFPSISGRLPSSRRGAGEPRAPRRHPPGREARGRARARTAPVSW